jgi:hypothetical protein
MAVVSIGSDIFKKNCKMKNNIVKCLQWNNAY